MTQVLKSHKVVFLLILVLAGIDFQLCAQGSGNPPNYPLKFTYVDQAGNPHDTLMTKLGFKLWKSSGQYPAYVKWKGWPFAVLRSNINGLGLFTDSSSSFTTGQTIGWVYYKTNSTGHFNLDYILSNIGMFINNSTTPNAQVIQTSQGIYIQAMQAIGPGTEITFNYQSILNMFPGDPTIKRAIKYW